MRQPREGGPPVGYAVIDEEGRIPCCTSRTGRPVRVPLLWLLAAHTSTMFPDFLFHAGVAHYRWMDLFLGHISTHFVPGRNVTWFSSLLSPSRPTL